MGATRLGDVATFSSPASLERRGHPRFPSAYRVLLRWIECDECHEELIRAEDVSRTGARLVVRHPLAEGEVVFVQGWNGDGFETRAEVRRVYIGRDGQARLGIRFLDAQLPDRFCRAAN
jgi:hypothetical protein